MNEDELALARLEDDGAGSAIGSSPAERLLGEARNWITDAFAGADELDLTDTQVRAGIERHYDGGWAGFTLDGAA